MAEADGVILSPSTLTSVLGACAKGARWEEALALLRAARPVLREAFLLSDEGADRDEERDGKRSPERAAAGVTGEGTGLSRRQREEDGGRQGRGGMRREENVVSAYTLAMVACRSAGRHAEGLEVLSLLEEDGGGRRREDESFFRVALKCCAKAPATAAGGRRGGGGKGGGREGGDGVSSGGGGGGGAAVADGVLEGMSALGIPCLVEGFTDVAQVIIF